MFRPGADAYQAGGADHFVSVPTASGVATHAGTSSRGEWLFNTGIGAIVSRDRLSVEVWHGGAGNYSIPAYKPIPAMRNNNWYYLYTSVRRSLVKTYPGKASVYAVLYRWDGSRWTRLTSTQSPDVFVPEQTWGGPGHTKSYVGWLGDRVTANPTAYARVSQYGRR